MKVKILCGISGSGKSTYIGKHFPNAVVCSADHYFIRQGTYAFDSRKLGEAHGECLRKYVGELQTIALELDSKGLRLNFCEEKIVVVDNTNTSIAEVAPYVALANAYGHDCEVIILQEDPVVAYKRNQHAVPLKSVMGQFDRLRGLEKSLPRHWNVKKVGRHETSPAT